MAPFPLRQAPICFLYLSHKKTNLPKQIYECSFLKIIALKAHTSCSKKIIFLQEQCHPTSRYPGATTNKIKVKTQVLGLAQSTIIFKFVPSF